MRILFLCSNHGARSRMAEAFARRLASPEHEFVSAGLKPGRLHPLAVEVLTDLGAPTDRTTAVSLAEIPAERVDLVVVIGNERDVAASVPAGLKHLAWPLMDPLDPPAPNGELKARFAELGQALQHHVRALRKISGHPT